MVDVAFIFLLVIGGLIVGWFTPTEAGGVGAGLVLLVGLARRKLTWQGFKASLISTTQTACIVLILLAGAMIFGRFLTVSGLPAAIADWVTNLAVPSIGILLAIAFIYLVAGMFMSSLAFMLISLPLFFPVVMSLGYNPIWFGIIIVMLLDIGTVTPPVGLTVYVLSGVVKDVPLETIFRGIMPFLIAMLVSMAFLIAFPQIALFLPGLMWQ